MFTYAQLREMAVQGVIRGIPVSPPLDRIRAVIDASFFQINSTVSEAFAAVDTKRELLRAPRTITFTDGVGTLPSEVLKKYIEDGTFQVTASPTPHYAYLAYPDYIRTFDKRLGYWTVVGETMGAKKPINGNNLTGDALTTFICSPTVPSNEGSTFDAPDDFVPDLLGALVEYVRGAMQETAAQTS